MKKQAIFLLLVFSSQLLLFLILFFFCSSFLPSDYSTQFADNIKGIRDLTILMAGDRVTTRLQKDMGVMQKDMGLMLQELTQLQTNVSQTDARIESSFKQFHETIKVDIRTELQNFFDQHVGRATPTTQVQTSDKGKGVLGVRLLDFHQMSLFY